MEKWPLHFKECLIEGDAESNIAVCCLWSKKEDIKKMLPVKKISVLGNLYTVGGISYMIKNILANPRIRYLIVCGEDLNGVSEVLFKLWENGVDNTHRIIDTRHHIHEDIPLEALEELRRNVKLVDMRGKEEMMRDFIEKHYEKAPFFIQPIVLGDVPPVHEIKTDFVCFRVEGKLGEVWLNALDFIMKFGEIKESEYGIKQKEILNLIAVIKEFEVEDFFNFTQEELENYYKSFFSDGKGSVEYTYGERLFSYSLPLMEELEKEVKLIINQIDVIVKKLKKSPHTRRAIAITWKVWRDLFSKNPPCLIQVVWNVKHGKLYQTCVFRSHDIFSAYLFNVFGLRKLQEMVAEKVGMEPGDLIVISNSAHIYENCWKDALEIVKKNKKKLRFVEDRLGYFLISVKEGKIVVNHFSPDGRRTFSFEGTSAEDLYKQIISQNLVSRLEHAAYLGKELMRAEMCLKEGKKYVQDCF